MTWTQIYFGPWRLVLRTVDFIHSFILKFPEVTTVFLSSSLPASDGFYGNAEARGGVLRFNSGLALCHDQFRA